MVVVGSLRRNHCCAMMMSNEFREILEIHLLGKYWHVFYLFVSVLRSWCTFFVILAISPICNVLCYVWWYAEHLPTTHTHTTVLRGNTEKREGARVKEEKSLRWHRRYILRHICPLSHDALTCAMSMSTFFFRTKQSVHCGSIIQ